jgi:hypothetical protein
MPDNKITANFFAPLLVELIQKQDSDNFSSLKEHIGYYKETRVKEDGYDLPASVKYFIEFMTTS